jgi:hypothetical protein
LDGGRTVDMAGRSDQQKDGGLIYSLYLYINGKFNYSNSLTLEIKILIVASIFLVMEFLGVTPNYCRCH